jgi:hypothetical protein
MTAYTFPRTHTLSPDIAERRAARKKVIEKARQLERESYKVCFASIRFRHCQITLPLFEREWQSLNLALRHYSLPKVQFATKTLPKDFYVFFRKRQAVLARKIGSCSHLYMAMRQGYLAINVSC